MRGSNAWATINDEDQSNCNSGEKAAQDPRRTSRRRQQDEQVHQYSPQGIGCLFCCEKKTMAVVLFVSMTSNVRRSMSVETRMVVYCAEEPPERMESKKRGMQFARCPCCRNRFIKSETFTGGYDSGFLFNYDVIRSKRSILTGTR